jgi:hypothetical protein
MGAYRVIPLPLSAYLGAFLGASLAANVALWSLWGAESARTLALQAETKSAVDANKSQTEAVADLQNRLTVCIGQADLIQELAEQAKADLERARTERNRLSAERRASLDRKSVV